ncbi:DUF3313 domain-containing protein [Schauerella aestuarii]|uniref:DUF3313 domain-containing protein n=1 Tax=Schauerella aestuarii TaxID=2511204 RepID=UPI0013698303|nr:DUF3313 domain-containing protein [Achromobacter aestuarii]MYZ43576.1 DUF3313 domain-containing protein [Achromobacter aestuarii]
MNIRTFLLVMTTYMLLALTGCAITPPASYADLGSSSKLQPNPDDATRMPYIYSPQIDWRAYTAAIVEPVAIYGGADHQFGDLPTADKEALADYMRKTFSNTLAGRFSIVDRAAAKTLRIKLTLTGAETNTAVVSTFTRFDLVGMPYNIVQSARGKEGMFMGSVSYSIEIYDAVTQELLKAYVTRQYPNAMNVGATFGSLGAAKTGIERGADDLLAQLE